MKRYLVVFFLFLSSMAQAVDLEPWYPKEFEIQPEICVLGQFSDRIASKHGSIQHPLHAVFLNGSAGIPIFNWYGQLEVSVADSTHRHFGFDHGTATIRYQLWDDVPGTDPVSAVVSLSISGVPTTALYDLSSFHHGKFEAITQIAVGKEFSEDQFWTSRFWGVLGMGSADVGSPWFHWKLCAEKNHLDICHIGVFVEGLFGLGGDALRLHHFHGYGPIEHRSIDLGCKYRALFDCGIQGEMGVSYRVYAFNYPKNAGSIWLSFFYPFGL